MSTARKKPLQKIQNNVSKTDRYEILSTAVSVCDTWNFQSKFHSRRQVSSWSFTVTGSYSLYGFNATTLRAADKTVYEMHVHWLQTLHVQPFKHHTTLLSDGTRPTVERRVFSSFRTRNGAVRGPRLLQSRYPSMSGPRTEHHEIIRWSAYRRCGWRNGAWRWCVVVGRPRMAVGMPAIWWVTLISNFKRS